MGFFHISIDEIKGQASCFIGETMIEGLCDLTGLNSLIGLCVAGVVRAFARVWVREELARQIGSESSFACSSMLYPMALYFFQYSWHSILKAALSPWAHRFLSEPVVGFLKKMEAATADKKSDSEDMLKLKNQMISLLADFFISQGLSQVISVFQKIFGAPCIHGGCVVPIYPRLNLPILQLLYNNVTYD